MTNIEEFILFKVKSEMLSLNEALLWIEDELKKIEEENNFQFKPFKIPFLPYQLIETDVEKRTLYQLRAEVDYKYYILNGLKMKLYNKRIEMPNILAALKNNKDILLFNVNKLFSQEQIQLAKSKAKLINRKWNEEK